MADNTQSEPVGGAADDTQPQARVMAQYIRDFSFENPNAPMAFEVLQNTQPKVDVNVNVGVRKLNDEVYEVELKLKATTTATQQDGQDMTVYIVELAYAGLMGVRNLQEETLRQYLMIGAPAMLFPFARRIVAEATRDGGFNPLYLEPINFEALYRQQQAQMDAQAAGENAEVTQPQPTELN